MRHEICRKRPPQPCAVASMLSYLSRVAGGCVPPQHHQQSLLPLIDDRVVCATTELARMAGCWAVLLPSALLVWIVCCNCKYTSAFPTQLKKYIYITILCWLPALLQPLQGVFNRHCMYGNEIKENTSPWSGKHNTHEHGKKKSNEL